MTPTRAETFLAELERHGNVAEAARVASPDSRHSQGAKSSFYTLRSRDRDFRRRWDRAVELADSRLEVEATRRAVDGVKRYEIQKGAVVRHPETGEPLEFTEYSDSLLALLLRSRIARYQDRRKLEVEHRVAADGFAVLRHEDLACLNEQDRRDLHRVLSKILTRRRELEGADADADDDAGEVLDLAFDEVEELDALPLPDLSADEARELEALA